MTSSSRGTIWLDITEADVAAALRYAIIVEWSTEDDAYVVSVPDFPDIHTHSATREEAAAMANEVIALALAAARRNGRVVAPPTYSALHHTGAAAAVSSVRRSA